VPEDHNPREITLELIGVSADKAPVGSELGADVRLLNSGKQSIQIPWSIDSKTVTDGQEPSHRESEGGSLEVLLRGQLDNDVLLESLTYPLYGSKFSPGSLLTLQPGNPSLPQSSSRCYLDIRYAPDRGRKGKWNCSSNGGKPQ